MWEKSLLVGEEGVVAEIKNKRFQLQTMVKKKKKLKNTTPGVSDYADVSTNPQNQPLAARI